MMNLKQNAGRPWHATTHAVGRMASARERAATPRMGARCGPRGAIGRSALLLLTLLLLLATAAGATTYYVSNSGNDSNSGTSSSSPWQTCAKVNAFVMLAIYRHP